MDKKHTIRNFFLSFLIVSSAFLIFISSSTEECYAATIHGSIYSFDLDKMQNVFLEVNSTPRQTFVSKTGDYLFELPLGTYSITATKNTGSDIQRADEIVEIETDGNYNIDLFLMTVLEDDLRNDNITDFNIDNVINYSKSKNTQKSYYLISIILALAIIVLILAILLIKKKRKDKKNKKEQAITSDIKDNIKNSNLQERIDIPDKNTEDTLKMAIFKEIELLDGRATQKDLRKKIPYSESKISLVITELEHEGKIKKIRKGRGNIIIINRQQ